MNLLKLAGISALVALLSACQTPSITYTSKAIGDNGEIKLPVEVITQDKPAPTIIVAHPSDGVNLGPGYNRYVNFWGSVLTSWGYNVVVPDSFTPRGYKNREVMYNAGLVNYHQRAEDLEQVAAWIKQQPWNSGKIGVMGFSHGGGAVNRISNVTNLISAGVAYYPGCFYSVDYKPKIPVQIHIGEMDTWTSPGRCEELVEMSEKQGSGDKYQLFIYRGATHAFDLPYPTRTVINYTLSHDPVAEKAALARTKEFFEKHLKN